MPFFSPVKSSSYSFRCQLKYMQLFFSLSMIFIKHLQMSSWIYVDFFFPTWSSSSCTFRVNISICQLSHHDILYHINSDVNMNICQLFPAWSSSYTFRCHPEHIPIFSHHIFLHRPSDISMNICQLFQHDLHHTASDVILNICQESISQLRCWLK